MLHIGLQLIEAQAPVLGEILVVQIFVDHHSDHAERQRSVGAGPDRDPLSIGSDGGVRAPRIDDHDICAALGCRFEAVHVERRRIGSWIGAPNYQEVGVLHVGEHIDQHAAHRDVWSNHRERDVAHAPTPIVLGEPKGNRILEAEDTATPLG